MEENKIICNSCGTENEEKYEFCKNCGTPLKREAADHKGSAFEGAAQNDNYTPPNASSFEQNGGEQSSNYTYARENSAPSTIEGIPVDEYAIFVGQKAPKYIPTFLNLEVTNTKIAWHWPTALLSFVFGPIGAAIWFFYRKLYKPAVILSLIGALLLVVNGIILAPTAKEVFKAFTSPDALSKITSEDFVDELEDITNPRSNLTDIINDAAGLGSAIICGMFTHYIYKKHIHKKITNYRLSSKDPRYYQLALASLGGTSGGMTALGIIVMLLAENIPLTIYILYAFLG